MSQAPDASETLDRDDVSPEATRTGSSLAPPTPIARWGAALLALALLVIYLPGLGHGFIKDDFQWIADSRVDDLDDAVGLLGHARGFYRPVVSVTFALNAWLFGLDPLGYGLTNLALVFAIAVAVWRLARTLGLSAGAAVLAATFWSLNFHGIRMAVLWISGRTALLVTLCAVLAATAFVRRRPVASIGWLLLAMLSKEEAVMLPVVLLAWAVVLARPRRAGDRSRLPELVAHGWTVVVPLVLYLALRLQTDAMTPLSAPPVYRFSFAPGLVLENVLEYFDRAATLPTASALVLTLVAGRRPALTDRHWRWMTLGAIWLAGGYAVTVFLPIRSSLYACLPSVGAALAGAGYLSSVWEASARRQRRRLLTVGLAAGLVAIPAHWARNQSWIRPADVSAMVMERLVEEARALPPGAGILIHEDLSAPTHMEHAFGTLIQTATALHVGRPVPVWIDPPPRDAAHDGRAVPGEDDRIALRLAIRDGRVVELE